MKFFPYLAGFLLLLAGCSDASKTPPQTALDAGRDFIRASLDGNFKAAEELMLKDSQNVQMFQSYKTYYDRLSDEKKQHYKQASYTINKYLDIDDSTSVINYSNSYMNKPMEIKVVRQSGKWQVDFKYISSGNLPID
ncbi:MAG: hypothetical protein WAT19_07215 [Ferruginibacter sp.]